MASKYLDRNGVELTPGQQVRMQVCVGPYGQTRQVAGELVGIDKWHGITIRLAPDTVPFTEYREVISTGRGFRRDYKAGAEYHGYPMEYDHARGAMFGYHRHNDVEHGHEIWIEVTK